MHGPIACEWKIASEQIQIAVTVPPNSSATLYVPTDDPAQVTEGNRPVEKAEAVHLLRVENGAAVYRVGSGRYTFLAPWRNRGSSPLEPAPR